MADHIANTSPLCYLHRAGILRVLPAIFGRVIVPGQVVAELGAGRARGYDLPDPLVLPWADVRTVAPLSPQLEPFGFLGAGERAWELERDAWGERVSQFVGAGRPAIRASQ